MKETKIRADILGANGLKKSTLTILSAFVLLVLSFTLSSCKKKGKEEEGAFAKRDIVVTPNETEKIMRTAKSAADAALEAAKKANDAVSDMKEMRRLMVFELDNVKYGWPVGVSKKKEEGKDKTFVDERLEQMALEFARCVTKKEEAQAWSAVAVEAQEAAIKAAENTEPAKCWVAVAKAAVTTAQNAARELKKAVALEAKVRREAAG
jgi:hypothetical protein